MKDKDRSSFSMPKARSVLLILLIVTIIVVVGLLVRGRSPQLAASVEIVPAKPTENHPVAKQPAVVRPPTANSIGTVEVCGYGQVPIDKDAAAFQHVGELTKGAGTRWLSSLQNSGDLRARVAGLLLEGKVTTGDPLRPIAEQTRNDVVQLAAGGRDPAVYAMTIYMCDASAAADPDSACQQISLQRWAGMDPDNAVPWLLLAGAARTRHDNAAETDAFSHAAKAHKVDSYSDSVFAFAEPELPQDVTPLERAYLAIEVIGVEAAIGSSQYHVASGYCSSDAIQDSNVRQQCDSLAELLVTRGTNLLDLGVGSTIGARAGWPTKRVNELLQDQHALMQAIVQQRPSGADGKLWTCDAVSRLNAYVVQRVRLGELGAARDALERSGEKVEAMAQKHAQYVDNIGHDALRQEQQNSPQTAP
jgi:hypothetical protein